MKISKISHKIILSLFVTLIICLFASQTVFSQTEKLGIVSYTAPKGWSKTTKENIVAFTQVNQATGAFCIITLYGATPGTGDPKSDFKREWNNLVIKPLNAEANPKTDTQLADGWTVISGVAAVDFQGGKSVAMLSVLSGGGKTISLLGVFNETSYMTQLTAFSSSMDVEKAVAETPAQPIVGPVPAESAAGSMHAAALVREFENNEIRAIPQYVGKRIRIHGIVNIIEINRAGQVVLTFKSSITTSGMARCYFDKSQSSRVGALNANEEATVEGTVKGLGDGFEGSKAYVVLLNCVVP